MQKMHHKINVMKDSQWAINDRQVSAHEFPCSDKKISPSHWAELKINQIIYLLRGAGMISQTREPFWFFSSCLALLS